MKNLYLQLILIPIGVILGIIVLYTLLQPLVHGNYYSVTTAEFDICGLDDGIIPQGFTYVEDKEVFLQTGYFTDGKANRVYIIDKSGKPLSYIELVNPDGSAHLGHPGGIAVGKDKVWIADDTEENNCIWTIPRDEFFSGKTRIVLQAQFKPECRAAYCEINNGILWVGEYEFDNFYPVKESHRFSVSANEVNTAIICGYAIDEAADTGIASSTPEKIISVCPKVQGISFLTDGRIVISVTHSVFNSLLDTHKNVLLQPSDTVLNVNGTDVPVWYLDSSTLEQRLSCPPLSEELALANGKLYIMYESASIKYLYGYLSNCHKVHSYVIE